MPQINYLKYLCAKHNVSLHRLSRDTGISIRCLRMYKNDRNQRGILWPRAVKLGEYFNVSALELVGKAHIELTEQEYQELFPIIQKQEDPFSVLTSLFLTQKRSLKDTIAYLNRNKKS